MESSHSTSVIPDGQPVSRLMAVKISSAEYRSILGRWWSEGFEFVFSWHDGALQARAADAPADRPPAVFEPLPDAPGELRTVSGRETGERLRLTRDARGVVVRMHWATYRLTRVQEAFDGVPATDG